MSEPINDGGPAFPCAFPEMGGGMTPGMSMRDWFAGQALAGMIACAEITKPTRNDYAKAAYAYADAMIAARGGAK